MEYHITNITVFGVISWSILFLLSRKIFHKRSFGFPGHLLCLIHSLIFIVLASYTVQDWTSPLAPLASISSPLQMKILAANLAFYIYDLGRFQFDRKNSPIFSVIHHIFVVAALIVALVYQMYGSEAMVEIWIGELPDPSLYLREMLKELGYKGTNLYFAVDISYVAVFVFSKMIFATYVIYSHLSGNYPLICKVVVLALRLLYVFRCYKLVRMFRYKYLSKQRRNSSQKTHST